MGFEDITPQLQMNARFVAHDTGANADTTSTGGTLLYLSVLKVIFFIILLSPQIFQHRILIESCG